MQIPYLSYSLDYEQSLFFLLSSWSRRKEIAKPGARKVGEEKQEKRDLTGTANKLSNDILLCVK